MEESMSDWRSKVQAVTKKVVPGKTNEDRVAAGMDAAMAAFKKGNEGVKRPTIAQVGDQVQFSVRFGTSALNLLENAPYLSVSTKDFGSVWTAIRAEVLAGGFSDQIAELSARRRGRKAAPEATKRRGRPPKNG